MENHKTDEARTKTVMYVALQIASALAILSEPFLPFTSKKLKEILRFTQNDNVTLSAVETSWEAISTNNNLLSSGHTIQQGKAELLFSKIDDDAINLQLEKLEANKKANAAQQATVEPQKPEITFEDFTKLDLRVGTILEAEKMPKTKKLLVLKVDTGIDVRTIVSGIAESFKPEDVVGKRVTVLVNLAPRALRGVESQGMILMTEDQQGNLVFVNPEASTAIDNGLKIS